MLLIKKKESQAEPPKKKAKYSDGIGAKKLKLTGVKKIFIIGAVAKCQETYPNVKEMMFNLQLSSLDLTISADIKLILTCLGKQGASCTYNCFLCQGKSPWKEKAELLTVGFLRQKYMEFLNSGADKADAATYQNVVNSPLLNQDDDVLLIDIFNFPTLHVHIGIVTKLVDYTEKTVTDAKIEDLDGDKFVRKFLKEEGIKRAEQRGGKCFEGNQAKMLLEKISSLEKYFIGLPDDVIVNLQKVIKVLQSFNVVVHSCFGTKLEPGYKEKIETFCKLYRELPGISFPPKFHLVEQHLVEYLERHGDGSQGLGVWSEQGFEAIHHDFKEFNQCYKVSLDHKDYGDKFLETMITYNSHKI